MKYLNDIVCELNEELSKLLPTNSKLAPIATQMVRTGVKSSKVFPSYVDDHGEARYVGAEDDFDVIIYHRALQLLPGKIISSWGDGKAFEVLQAKMTMVVFGRRNILKMAGDDMAMRLVTGFPTKASPALINKLNFRSVEFKPTDSNINSLQVFSEEYPDSELFLKPEQFLIRINYTIESVFLKGCFNPCE